ncbi:MAG: hypothetical protein ABF313_02495, partial [Marivita sp.]
KAPGISHYIVPKTDHKVAAELRDRGALRPLMQNLINRKPRLFRKNLTDLGGISVHQFTPPPSSVQNPANAAVF